MKKDYLSSPVTLLAFVIANCLALLLPKYASASETSHWRCLYTHCSKKHDTPLDAAHEELQVQNWSMNNVSWSGCNLLSDTKARCYFKSPNVTGGITVYRFGIGCYGEYLYNVGSGICESPEDSEERKQRGAPPRLACVGNPINVVTGNKFQAESDYTSITGDLNFTRYYNSSDGLWRHSFSTKLVIGEGAVSLMENDGKALLFTKIGTTYEVELGEFGLIWQNNNSWTYRSREGVEKHFDREGRLTDVRLPSGEIQRVTYSPTGVTVSNDTGKSLSFTQDDMSQPLTLAVADMIISFKYDAKWRLVEAVKLTADTQRSRSYYYELNDFPRILTGVKDERGFRYATWAYDDQGRAISSEHADGADKVTVAYKSDGTVSVTNELGKVAKYSFQYIKGVNRITAIEGEPSPNCPNSNSTFTYDNRGLLKTKTDNKGNLTTYTYNDRGLEISRTEASGTPQARTITTDWHADFFLPVKVTEPDRITQYSYDAQGRQTSQAVTPR